MKQLRNYITISGWAVFLFTTIVYLFTIESSASFWDCGEFIAASYKLEIGHPPGAPLFLLMGRVFSLFAGSNTQLVAVMINSLSALASSFTILFLFWTIAHLAIKLTGKKENYSVAEIIIILASATLGSLSYAFSDTFWFSAVEGEVYASSSLFTAIVFWAILKWEDCAEEKNANRWIILIAYLMGLSIGIHLLNLLAIPSIVLIYYFKKYTVSVKGVLAALLISVVILSTIMYILVPGIVFLAAFFERVLINFTGLPYWSGVFIYLVLLLALLSAGIFVTHKRQMVLLNTIVVMIAVVCIGYSSYATIVIRSMANPPMDQNNPENMYNLLYYLNREQYGDRPLFRGQHFNAIASYSNKKKPVYAPVDGKYEIIALRNKLTYDTKYTTFFPRMWSNEPSHINAYMKWANIEEKDYFYPRVDENQKPLIDQENNIIFDYQRPKKKPSFTSNISFLMSYQLSHMYFRYFMWNFSGRQNDIQAQYKEEINKGNWTTGIKFIDSYRLGPQEGLTRLLKENKARNSYYAIPLILGLLGMFYHMRKSQRDFWVVLCLFFFTGIAIVIYLNQNPMQPRERDYAYAGSFYAFCIWIGLAIPALIALLKEKLIRIEMKSFGLLLGIGSIVILIDFIKNKGALLSPTIMYILIGVFILYGLMKLIALAIKSDTLKAVFIFAITLSAPILMAKENWDDHNRKNRQFARDMAANYLNSCEENAILFTNGDNDTFPLWYAQEVEGIRTDVRVVNLSYLNADWYIEQMERKAYKSDPLPISLSKDKYRQGKRDIVYLIERVNRPITLKEAIEFVGHEEADYKTIPGVGELIDYIPQKRFIIGADSPVVLENGTIKPETQSKYVPFIDFTIKKNLISKNHLMVLDFLSTNEWHRPIYFAITVPSDNYLGLSDYFEMAGLTYRIVPARMKDSIFYYGGINAGLMYDRLMNKFQYGNIGDPELYYDENITGMLINLRNNFNNCAKALLRVNKPELAIEVLERNQELLPDKIMPFDLYALSMAETYFDAGDSVSAKKVIEKIYVNTKTDLRYYQQLSGRFKFSLDYEKRVALHVLNELARILYENGDEETGIRYSKELQTIASTLSFK